MLKQLIILELIIIQQGNAMDINSNNNQDINQPPITPQPNPNPEQPINLFQSNDSSNLTNNNQDINQPPITPQPNPNQTVNPSGSFVVTNPNDKSTKSSRKFKIMILIIVLIVVILGAFLAYKYLLKKNNNGLSYLNSSNSASSAPGSYSNTGTRVGQASFLSQPKLLTYQPIYKNACKTMPKNNTIPNCNIFYFYQVGTTTGNKPIIVAVDFNSQMAGSSGGYFYAVFIKESASKYELIKQYNLKLYPNYSELSSNSSSSAPQNELTSSITVNLSNSINNSLKFPSTVNLTNNTILTKDNSVVGGNWFIKNLAGILVNFGDLSPINIDRLNLIGHNGNYSYFDYSSNLASSLNDNAIFGTLQNDFAGLYQLKQPIVNNSTPSIIWNNGQVNNKKYVDTFSTCSLNGKGYMTVSGLNSGNLTIVGKLNSQKVYQLSTSNPVFQEYYKTNFPSTATPYSHSSAKLSLQQYENQYGVILMKNSLNQYVVYQLASFAAGTAC